MAHLAPAVLGTPPAAGMAAAAGGTLVRAHIRVPRVNNDVSHIFFYQKELGTGGFGSVHRAKYIKTNDDRFGQWCAVKRLNLINGNNFSLNKTKSALRELKTLGFFMQPGLPPQLMKIYDAVLFDNHIISEVLVAMEECHTDLRLFIKYICNRKVFLHDWAAASRTPLVLPGGAVATNLQFNSIHQCVMEGWIQYFGREIYRGLQYLHETLHLRHNDIKLDNILMTRNCEIKIGDYGMLYSTRTNTVVGGTHHYLAPEVFDRHRTQSTKSDVYAAAITMAYMDRDNMEVLVREMFNATTLTEVLDFGQNLIAHYWASINWSDDLKNFFVLTIGQDQHARPTATGLLHDPFFMSFTAEMENKTREDLQMIQDLHLADKEATLTEIETEDLFNPVEFLDRLDNQLVDPPRRCINNDCGLCQQLQNAQSIKCCCLYGGIILYYVSGRNFYAKYVHNDPASPPDPTTFALTGHNHQNFILLEAISEIKTLIGLTRAGELLKFTFNQNADTVTIRSILAIDFNFGKLHSNDRRYFHFTKFTSHDFRRIYLAALVDDIHTTVNNIIIYKYDFVCNAWFNFQSIDLGFPSSQLSTFSFTMNEKYLFSHLSIDCYMTLLKTDGDLIVKIHEMPMQTNESKYFADFLNRLWTNTVYDPTTHDALFNSNYIELFPDDFITPVNTTTAVIRVPTPRLYTIKQINRKKPLRALHSIEPCLAYKYRTVKFSNLIYVYELVTVKPLGGTVTTIGLRPLFVKDLGVIRESALLSKHEIGHVLSRQNDSNLVIDCLLDRTNVTHPLRGGPLRHFKVYYEDGNYAVLREVVHTVRGRRKNLSVLTFA